MLGWPHNVNLASVIDQGKMGRADTWSSLGLLRTTVTEDCGRSAVLALIVVIGLGLAACSGGATQTATPPAEAAGAELYAATCQVCHGDQQGQGGTGAPSHNQEGHTWHHPDAQLTDWVMNGKVGFGQMPAFRDKLTDPELDAIMTFIKTWWTPGQRDDQADISRRYQEALDRQKSGG